MVLKIRWPHDLEKVTRRWPHEPANWQRRADEQQSARDRKTASARARPGRAPSVRFRVSRPRPRGSLVESICPVLSGRATPRHSTLGRSRLAGWCRRAGAYTVRAASNHMKTPVQATFGARSRQVRAMFEARSPRPANVQGAFGACSRHVQGTCPMADESSRQVRATFEARCADL